MKLTKKEIIEKLVPKRYCIKSNKVLCNWGGFRLNNYSSLVCSHILFKNIKTVKKYVHKTSKIKAPKWCPYGI